MGIPQSVPVSRDGNRMPRYQALTPGGGPAKVICIRAPDSLDAEIRAIATELGYRSAGAYLRAVAEADIAMRREHQAEEGRHSQAS
jgi:hypothetical protein